MADEKSLSQMNREELNAVASEKGIDPKQYGNMNELREAIEATEAQGDENEGQITGNDPVNTADNPLRGPYGNMGDAERYDDVFNPSARPPEGSEPVNDARLGGRENAMTSPAETLSAAVYTDIEAYRAVGEQRTLDVADQPGGVYIVGGKKVNANGDEVK